MEISKSIYKKKSPLQLSKLSECRKHEYLSALLRKVYTESCLDCLQEYTSLTQKSIEHSTKKEIADLYHYHRQFCSQPLREDRLLPIIKEGDRAAETPFLNVSIFLDHLRSAHNVGSIIRTCEAFRLGRLFGFGTTPSATNDKVSRTAMGASKAVCFTSDVPISTLPRPVIALETAVNATDIHHFAFPSVFTLAVGNEEYGCSDTTLAEADHLIRIPLYGSKNSLNVANAFAIAAAEISRQLRIE